VVRDGQRLPLARALEVEAGAFSELVVAEPAKSLMAVFFAKNAVEARAGRASRLAEGAPPLATAAVLGAGFMGAGIAQGLAEKGVSVILKDRDLEAVARGMRSAGARFADLARRRRLSQPEARAAMARLHPSDSYAGFARVELAIEAVFEDLEIKRQVLREVEAASSERLVFASNTSAIPIARIAEASRRPENVVGMHFFSPVHRMPLLEVVRQPRTSPAALATAVAAGRRMGKTVIVVGDGPGFFTSRVLAPFLNEAAFLLLEGARIDRVDAAMTRWGWPVGPFALLDEVGLDVARHVSGVVVEALGDRLLPPPVFARLAAEGRLGRKSGRGFYLYDDGGKRPDAAVYALARPDAGRGGGPTDAEIAERCYLQMLNETARCMEEGVIADPADVDIGAIFGFGFPAFRGGLLREADRRGLPRIVDSLDAYTARLGRRFEPAGMLREMARRNESFHGGDRSQPA
jgi:3-hydroxyacyl-CoA dehydrogenase/enoyl-CoA hydratase/3-hydroxybutyryl-CoA epimerase